MSLLATIIPPFSLICKSSLNPLAYQIRLMEREREKRERVNKGIFRLVSSFESCYDKPCQNKHFIDKPPVAKRPSYDKPCPNKHLIDKPPVAKQPSYFKPGQNKHIYSGHVRINNQFNWHLFLLLSVTPKLLP